ncbi:hypothetical protein LWI29_027258 [Acer saccharum]|uniref:Uncharacterized protein n=1 Tax=Acer saccharum TaxID=4024 RepID=A0AA39S598_ACESA|nr:hypothetical protein LWI29_027258 [Acer saccharum]
MPVSTDTLHDTVVMPHLALETPHDPTVVSSVSTGLSVASHVGSDTSENPTTILSVSTGLSLVFSVSIPLAVMRLEITVLARPQVPLLASPSLPIERPLRARKHGWQVTSPYIDPYRPNSSKTRAHKFRPADLVDKEQLNEYMEFKKYTTTCITY